MIGEDKLSDLKHLSSVNQFPELSILNKHCTLLRYYSVVYNQYDPNYYQHPYIPHHETATPKSGRTLSAVSMAVNLIMLAIIVLPSLVFIGIGFWFVDGNYDFSLGVALFLPALLNLVGSWVLIPVAIAFVIVSIVQLTRKRNTGFNVVSIIAGSLAFIFSSLLLLYWFVSFI